MANPTSSLQDKVILVTGAAKRIGRGMALRLAREGARVAITYRSNKGAAEETVTHIDGAGGHGFAVPMDLTEPSGIDNAVAQIVKHWGHIDVLIGNDPAHQHENVIHLVLFE